MPDSTRSSAVPYMLLFRNTGPEVFASLNADERQRLCAAWNAWFEGLLAEGKAVEGQPLSLETRVVSGRDKLAVMDGPFAETKEAVGGYVVLLVSGLDEATEIAKRHPALVHGMQIEIRRLMPASEVLDVTIRSRFATE